MCVYCFVLLCSVLCVCVCGFVLSVHSMQKQDLQGCVVLCFTTNPYYTLQYYALLCFFCFILFVCFVLICVLCVYVFVSKLVFLFLMYLIVAKGKLLGLASGNKFVPKV